MTASGDDDQPTAVANDGDVAAVMPDSARTAAAEQRSDAPTTIVPDVGSTQAAELAWSSEAETEEMADHPRRWRRRLLWVPLVALLCASVAVVVWFSVTLYRQGRPDTASPSVPAPVAAPPAPLRPPPPPAAISPPPAPAPPSAAASSPLPTDSRGLPMLPENPTPDQQQEVITRFFDHFGIPYANPPAAAIDAQSVCGYLKSGHRRAIDLIMWAQQTHPDLRDVPPAINFVTASIGTYCPQYGYLIAQPSSDATS